MENREIIDKTYYLLEESMTKDRTPGFFTVQLWQINHICMEI